jgi:hypothetical protein
VSVGGGPPWDTTLILRRSHELWSSPS